MLDSIMSARSGHFTAPDRAQAVGGGEALQVGSAPAPPRGRRRGPSFPLVRRDPELALVATVAAALLVRVLTDDRAPSSSRHSGSLNLSGAIALALGAVAIALLARRRNGLRAAVLCAAWLCTWTAVAAVIHGASGAVLREGVREASVLAVAVIVVNARGGFQIDRTTRLVQLLVVVPAVVALYQLAAGTGMDIAGEWRANGTLAHPDSAAMFFAVGCAVSMWRFMELGRSRLDLALAGMLGVAVLATASIDGLLALCAMLVALAVDGRRAGRSRLLPLALACVLSVLFVATPLGSGRLAAEAHTSLSETNTRTSLAWRVGKWESLLPEWRRSPVLGRGLGSTLTEQPRLGDEYAGKPPHNEYVRYLVETGILGLALLLVGLAVLVRSLLARGRSSGETGAAARLALVLVVGALVNALADNTFANSPTCYLLALVIGAALAAAAPFRAAPGG
jgi:O-antigen ligase